MPTKTPAIRCQLGEQVFLPARSLAVTVKEIQELSVVLEVERSGLDEPVDELSQQIRHDIRNHLNTISIGINLLGEELAAGDAADAAETLKMIQEHVGVLTGHPLFVRS